MKGQIVHVRSEPHFEIQNPHLGISLIPCLIHVLALLNVNVCQYLKVLNEKQLIQRTGRLVFFHGLEYDKFQHENNTGSLFRRLASLNL